MIEWILKQILRVVVYEGPHRDCLISYIILVSLSLVITHECSVLASIDFNCDIGQHSLVELKHGGHLNVNHADQVQKLNENRTSLFIFVVFIVMPESSGELMTKREPFFFNKLLEPSDSPVSAIQ